MEHYSGTTKVGTNIYSTKNPEDIDLICLYAVAYWYNEIKLYDFDNPKYSVKTGHFTAMVWKATEQFGLGEEGQADGNFYVVAAYDPRGNMMGGYAENVERPRKVQSSCIEKVANKEHYTLLMKYLNVDPETNKFVYKSDEPCVLPQKPASTSGSKTDTTEGTTGTQVGTTGTQVGTTGTQVGTTGTQMGKTGGEEGAVRKIPNEIMVVPVSEHVAAAHEGPEIIVGPPEGVPQTVPNVIVIPATQLHVAQRLPDGNGAKPQTTTPLPVRVSSTISIVPLNSTVHPSSSFVSPTVSVSTSLY